MLCGYTGFPTGRRSFHAEDDPLAFFEDAKRMVERVPDATFRRSATGGHLVFGHGGEIRQTVTEFVTTPESVPGSES